MIVESNVGESMTHSDERSTVAQTFPNDPVTWHVIIWILITLGVNSMAQPSRKLFTHFSRHRIYICVSPIICLADAVVTVAYIFIAKVFVNVSFKKASQIVVLIKPIYGPSEFRKQPRLDELQTEDSVWPRFIFFVLGPFPAAIKLASFSGTLWTKTWGMMFISSFILNEISNFMARRDIDGKPISISSILDSDLMEQTNNQEQTLDARANIQLVRAGQLQQWIGLFLVAPFVATGALAHMYLMAYAVYPFWSAAWRYVPLSVIDIIKLISSINLLLAIPCLCCWLAVLYSKYVKNLTMPRLQKWSKVAFQWTCIVSLSAFSPTYPANHVSHHEEFGNEPQKVLFTAAICTYTYLVHLGCHWGIIRICACWPSIARVLLVDQIQETESVQTHERDPHPSNQLLHGTIDDDGWMFLGFFVVNVLLCSLWYAYIYDPVGTTNPSWTNVFG